LNVVFERFGQFVWLLAPRPGDRDAQFPRALVIEIAQLAGAFSRVKVLWHVGAVVDKNVRLQPVEHGVDFIVPPTKAAMIMLIGRAFLPLRAGPIRTEVQPVRLRNRPTEGG
jgi:hypothetical protein